jgi:hypothetical protein
MALRLWSRGTHKAQQSESRKRTFGPGVLNAPGLRIEFCEAGKSNGGNNKIGPLILRLNNQL